MYRLPDNRGTNPHLRSGKFTGYDIVLRAAVDTPSELSIHLQQIDEGPNYRWGRAGEGGCGILYFYAGGKSYSYTAPEDVGDRDDQDTDFCTTFGVYKEDKFHSIGMNVLSRPLYDLGTGQLAELVPREGPSAYASPEYLSRSVLLAGDAYFVLYDRVANHALTHRLTWFVRKGDALPSIQLLRGAAGSRETQRTELSTSSATGVWFDGLGDSLAVVSHRNDIEAEGTSFGCRVRLPHGNDVVFHNPTPIRFAEGTLLFEGTAGLIRTTKDKTEFSLFHGTRIGVSGLLFTRWRGGMKQGVWLSIGWSWRTEGQPSTGDRSLGLQNTGSMRVLRPRKTFSCSTVEPPARMSTTFVLATPRRGESHSSLVPVLWSTMLLRSMAMGRVFPRVLRIPTLHPGATGTQGPASVFGESRVLSLDLPHRRVSGPAITPNEKRRRARCD